MRCLFKFLCVCALGVMPLVGCSETTGDGGSGGDAGSGGTAGDGGSGGDAGSGGTAGGGGSGGMPDCQSPEDCDDRNDCTDDTCADGICEYSPVADGTACDENNECTLGMCASGECDTTPVADGTACGNGAGTCQLGICSQVACSEQGIRDAIAAGGGPYTFDCDGPTTLVTTDTILIDKDVVLDGEGNLTLDGDNDHPVLASGTPDSGTVELRGFRVTGAPEFLIMGAGYAIYVCCDAATLILKDSTVSDNGGVGILNQESTLILLNTTVSENGPTNVLNLGGTLTVTNSTISGGEVGISNGGQMTVSNSTVVSENVAVQTPPPGEVPPPTAAFASTFANTIVTGRCEGDVVNNVTSGGYNVESPGNTCGFDPDGTDLVDVPDPMIGPLQDNGGPTETHALLPGSPALDQIPVVDCEVSDDQRGVARPQGPACDVGAFELEVAP